MANSPPSVYVLDYSTNVEVRILLPTQLLDPTPVGSPLGTGGPGAANAETPGATDIMPQNRIVRFRGELYALIADSGGATVAGVYREDQGGAGQWGQVLGIALVGESAITGLFVLHPSGVPTLVVLFRGSGGQLQVSSSTDGTTWNTSGVLGGIAASTGEAVPFRNSIFWTGDQSGIGGLLDYDFALSAVTSYPFTSVFASSSQGSCFGITVHDNVVFMSGWRNSDTNNRIVKVQAGSLVTILDFVGGQTRGVSDGHSCMFTDPATGDLIAIWSGQNQATAGARTLVQRIENATGAATPVTDISSTVLGAVEGADKYLEGGGSASVSRSWYVYVDNDTDPLNPRVFLFTFASTGAVTEMWEWKGIAAEIELVGAGAGISTGQFGIPTVAFGGGERSVISASIEIGDSANQDFEDTTGRRFYWRAIGSGGPFVGTFYVSGGEGFPDTVAPIAAGSLVVESGVPATSPSISGNTITNITPDDGTVLYSVALDLSAVSLGAGAPGRLMGDLV